MRLLTVKTETLDVIKVEEMRAQVGVIHGADDGLLTVFAKQGLEQVSIDTNRSLIDTVWQLSGSAFLQSIKLPKPPFVEILSVHYIDANGDEQLLDVTAYRVIKSDVGACLMPAQGASWPVVQRNNPEAVTIQFRAGYSVKSGDGIVGEIPISLKQAALLWAAHLYNYREAITPMQANELPSYRCMVAPFQVDLI